MLWVLLGTDRKKINSFIKKSVGEAPLQKLDIFSWDADMIRSSIESNSLFGDGAENFVLEGIGENEETWHLLVTLVEGMASSTKSFFIVEGDLAEETTGVLIEKGAKLSDFREKKQEKWQEKFNNDKYNPFALVDAVGRRSAKEAWIEYERARLSGALPEELHVRVWSKARDIISSREATAIELGLHPFVYKKAKAHLKNWPPEALQNLIKSLLKIYHESRLGGDELDLAMEKALLSI